MLAVGSEHVDYFSMDDRRNSKAGEGSRAGYFVSAGRHRRDDGVKCHVVRLVHTTLLL